MAWLLAALGAVLPACAQSTSGQDRVPVLSVALEPGETFSGPSVRGPQAGGPAVHYAQLARSAPDSRQTQAGQPTVRRSTTSGPPAKQPARLGIVLKEGTRIYRSAATSSPVLFRCGKGTALGLVGQTKRYYAVLMIDRSYGFVDKSRVELYSTPVSVNPDEAQATQRVVTVALEYIGVPYVWGGNTRSGIDCSGFVKAVFRRFGVELPRVAREQINVGRAVRWGELTPGDRLYFSTHGSVIDHTGIYIGGGRFIHASGSAGAVVVSSVTEPKFYRSLVAARRSI